LIMNYREIIREMELSGHHGEADDLRLSMEEHGIPDQQEVRSRSDARDGLSYSSYAGDMAERAYDYLRRHEEVEEER